MINYNFYRFSRIIQCVRSFDAGETRGKKWLDLGCHNGTFAGILCTHGYRVSGVDVWDPKLKTDTRWEYVQCDLNSNRAPIDDSTFDVVSALELIEHIIDTDKFLEEIHRILKPGGLFALSTPNICMLKNRFRVPFGYYPYGPEYRNIIHHVRLYNFGCLVSHLEEHNFKVLLVEGEKLIPQKLIITTQIWRLSKFFARIFPKLCSNLMAVACVCKS